MSCALNMLSMCLPTTRNWSPWRPSINIVRRVSSLSKNYPWMSRRRRFAKIGFRSSKSTVASIGCATSVLCMSKLFHLLALISWKTSSYPRNAWHGHHWPNRRKQNSSSCRWSCFLVIYPSIYAMHSSSISNPSGKSTMWTWYFSSTINFLWMCSTTSNKVRRSSRFDCNPSYIIVWSRHSLQYDTSSSHPTKLIGAHKYGEWKIRETPANDDCVGQPIIGSSYAF